MPPIIDLNHDQLKELLLQSRSYSDIQLPPYFDFSQLLLGVSSILEGAPLERYIKRAENDRPCYPSNCEDVNYRLLSNKDGKFDWRPLDLIHPAIYVSLVHLIAEPQNWEVIRQRFRSFQGIEGIECASIPNGERFPLPNTLSSWYHNVELRSIELALDFKYVYQTDIAECYSSIYTHSIPWALHTKAVAKRRRRDLSMVGNQIDRHLQWMSNGQTNGIPQGSVLMDIIAELVLGYVDELLSERIQDETEWRIIRFRDDYRIFVNNPTVGEKILQSLNIVLSDFNLKLNKGKTYESDDVVESMVKEDKLYWKRNKVESPDNSVLDDLLIIKGVGNLYPNSGTVYKLLRSLSSKLSNQDHQKPEEYLAALSILADIAQRHPRTIPLSVSSMSKILANMNTDQQAQALNRIRAKFMHSANFGLLDLYLQRISLNITLDRPFEEPLCQLVQGNNIEIWQSEWLLPEMKDAISCSTIIDREIVDELGMVLELGELPDFFDHYQ